MQNDSKTVLLVFNPCTYTQAIPVNVSTEEWVVATPNRTWNLHISHSAPIS